LQYFTGATGGVTYDGQGNATIQGSNQTANWSTLSSAAQDAIQKIQALGDAANGAAAPIISIAAYGASAGYKTLPGATPGLTSSDYTNIITTNPTAPAWPGVSQSGVANPYSTPAPGSPSQNQPIVSGQAYTTSGQTVTVQLTTPIYLDSQLLAQAVNSYNATLASNKGLAA
jgi:hypothetical protein